MNKSLEGKNIFTLLIGVVLCIALAVAIFNKTRIDNIVLLENRNPEYWDLLSDSNGVFCYFNTDFSQDNFLSIDASKVSGQKGINATIDEDGKTIYLSGEEISSEDAWIQVAEDGFSLPDGEYDIALNTDTVDDNIALYIIGISSRKANYIFESNDKDTLIIDDTNNSYIVGIHIRAGARINGTIVVSPTISKRKDLLITDENISSDTKAYRSICFSINKEELESITKSDLRIFLNRSRNSYDKEYDWASLIVRDDEDHPMIGYQFIGGLSGIRKGKVNKFGMISDFKTISDEEFINMDMIY